MNKLKLVVVLLVSITFVATVRVLYQQNSALVCQLKYKTTELNSTTTELQQVKTRLAIAEGQLGFLDKNRTAVQVTAYTKSSSPNAVFSNGRSVKHTYAVATHTLPEDHIIYVALSPTAQVRLHAKMNDYIVLIHRHHKVVARYVDNMPAEHRSVVDVYFADEKQAWLWGRKADYYAVNISSFNSPFRGVLDNHGS